MISVALKCPTEALEVTTHSVDSLLTCECLQTPGFSGQFTH